MSILPLSLDKVSFRAGDRALLDGISLTIESGPKTVILGANGAGKSLLLRICHGLLGPSGGEVRWAEGTTRQYERQAMVFQKPVMLRRSVAANVAYGLKLRKVEAGERARRVADALRRTGLTDFADQPARLLSGGEQQRLALARIWALEPEILFLDEPTANLDPGATRAVEEIVSGIHDSGAKIVMTTHDIGQARRLADEVIFLHRGRVAERAGADTFFVQPSTEEAAAYLRGDLLW